MNEKRFKSLEGLELVVKNRKSAVIFEIDQDEANENDRFSFRFQFTPEDFWELLKYIELIANESWSNLTPREANSFESDYCEYYDKKFDSNGDLTIRQNTLLFTRPSLSSKKLYQFNKRRMESFIYDFRKMVPL